MKSLVLSSMKNGKWNRALHEQVLGIGFNNRLSYTASSCAYKVIHHIFRTIYIEMKNL